MKPEITIGVCVRNNASTIREAFKSILSQGFPPELIEIIVVVGNSEDDTLPLVNETLKNAETKSKVFCENKGLGSARQLVVNNAKGRYIVWVDGDMIITQGYVSKLSKLMEKHPNMGIIKGRQSLEPGQNLLATLEAHARVASKMVDYGSKKASSKVLGTSGCIYRTVAIKKAGGFDENLKGYCEDWDAEIRVRALGWSMSTTDAKYFDYERNRLTWKDLWRRYWLRGYYTHYFLHKKKGLLKHYRMFPFAGAAAGLIDSFKLFKLTGRKSVFLLPLPYFFKLNAWYVGFIHSHLANYEPNS